MNQANRGALVRSPTPERLAVFLDRLKDDPTALWYFLTIHRDAILLPMISYLKWKNTFLANKKAKAVATTAAIHQQQQVGHKRSLGEALSLPLLPQSKALNSTNSGGVDANVANNTNHKEHPDLVGDCHTIAKRSREFLNR